MQPCDVSLFHPLKNAWREAAENWRSKYKRIGHEDFAIVLKTATDSLDFAKIMENGFRRCGLYPFSPDALDYNVLDKKFKSRAKNSQDTEKNAPHTSSSDLPVTERNANNSSVSCDSFLDFFEKSLASDLLEEFKKGNISDAKNEGLFNYWMSLKNKYQSGADPGMMEDIRMDAILLNDQGNICGTLVDKGGHSVLEDFGQQADLEINFIDNELNDSDDDSEFRRLVNGETSSISEIQLSRESQGTGAEISSEFNAEDTIIIEETDSICEEILSMADNSIATDSLIVTQNCESSNSKPRIISTELLDASNSYDITKLSVKNIDSSHEKSTEHP